MATTMKAAVCKEPNAPLTIETFPIPEPTGRELRVRIKAASLCHSDLTVMSGKLDRPDTSLFPIVPGHEAVSVVDKLGPDAAAYGLQEGDLIGAPLWQNMCLTCIDCRTVGPDSCPQKQMAGITRPGTFAEFGLVDAASAVVISRAGDAGQDEGKIPSPAALSPLFCAGITVWDALERAQLQRGETVAVVGAGGLGELAVRYAHALGGRVLALDVQDEQLEACKDSAEVIINTRTTSPDVLKDKISAVSGRPAVDVVIVTAGVVAAYETAMGIVRFEGRLIAVGMPVEPLSVSLIHFGILGLRMIGARAPGREGTQRCLDFSLREKIFPRVNPRVFRLEEANEMTALMEAGHVQEGRMVIEFL